MRIAIAVPMPDRISPEFTRNLIGIITRTMEDFPDAKVDFIDKSGVRTDKNRNVMLDVLLQTDVDYILWLDADMIFPLDIVKQYLEHDFDVMGCLYFKRSPPHDPVAYIDSSNPYKPYRAVDPMALPEDGIVQVTGLGYGGMMVNRKVYDAMGDDKWCNYGLNFHLPFEAEDRITHDLQFCKNVLKHGFRIYLHCGVRPGHIGDSVVTIDNWMQHRKEGVGRLRKENINTKEYWDKKYQDRAFEYTATVEKNRVRFEKALDSIIDGNSVLDIGCGNGDFLQFVQDRRSNVSLYGIDISEYAVMEAAKYVDGAFLIGDVNTEEIKGIPPVDVVFMGETLEHLEDPGHALREAVDILKPGGRLVITTPYMNAIDSQEHVFGYDEERIKAMLDAPNMHIEKIFNDKIMFCVYEKSSSSNLNK